MIAKWTRYPTDFSVPTSLPTVRCSSQISSEKFLLVVDAGLSMHKLPTGQSVEDKRLKCPVTKETPISPPAKGSEAIMERDGQKGYGDKGQR